MTQPVDTAKLNDLGKLIECQNSIIADALNLRDNASYYERTCDHLRVQIKKLQTRLDSTIERHDCADEILVRAHDRRTQLKKLIKQEKHKVLIARFTRMRDSYDNLQGEDLH